MRRRPHSAPVPLIEPLESRIAPAAIVFDAANYSDTKVISSKHTTTTLQFFNADDPSLSGANKAIAATVGDNPEIYFIKLTAGQELAVNTQVGFQSLVNVTSGTVIAFFTDPDSTVFPAPVIAGVQTVYPVLADHLSGLSLGTKVSVGIGGSVNGDVVTNYNDLTGMLGGGPTGNLLPNLVTDLSVAGDITGSFIAGAAVSHFTAVGFVNTVLTGTAANGHVVNFTSLATTAGAQTLTVPTPAAKLAGPSITNAVIGSTSTYVSPGVGGIQLGNGGPGAAGGSINGLTFLSDTTGFSVIAGNGGAGGAGRTAGGAGGTINNLVVHGPLTTAPDTTPNSTVLIEGGAGGAGLGSAKGGAGGAVSNVFIDYTTNSVNATAITFINDNVTIQGGAGGSGGTAGAGGALSNVNVSTATPHDLALINNAVEIQLLGGLGGISSIGGKGGSGGSITNSQVLNQALPAADPNESLPNDVGPASPTNTYALIEGGAGGSSTVKGAGGVGGSVNSLTLKGFNFEVEGGAGGAGASSGGAGGGINTVTVLGSSGSLPGDDFHVETLVLATGAGGNAVAGKGGAAGSVSTVTIGNSNFGPTHLDLNPASATYGQFIANGLQITTGNGGAAAKGAGGAGGNVSNVRATGIDFLTDSHPFGNTGVIGITTGDGGSAPVAGGKGGAGGSVSDVTYLGTRLETSSVTTGKGGNGGANGAAGKGGAGGAISSVSIRAAEDLYPTILTTTEPTGLLVDTTANFVTEGVEVGDTVMDGNTLATTTVAAVTATQLSLQNDIFATGDPYTVERLQPAPSNQFTTLGTGTAMDSHDLLTDAYNFINDGVQIGDTVEDITSGTTATVTNVAAHQLTLNADIVNPSDQYAFVTLGSGTPNAVQYSGNTIIDPNSNFLAEGIQIGDTVEDYTATQADLAFGDTIPTTATVIGVTAHSLTVDSFTFSVLGDQYDFPTLLAAHSSFTGGAGGTGFLNGAGGAGGGILNSNAVVPGAVSFTGGNGGAGGATAAAGAGGTLNNDGAFSSNASGSLIAGNAGSSGGKAGAGGSVIGADVQVLTDVTLIGGAGTAGGAGGNITSNGFSGVLQSGAGFNPPSGNIMVHAGAGGSSTTGNGGAGGTVSGLTGFISSGEFGAPITTQFDGGLGGNGLAKAGAGGSVNNVRIFGGGGAGVTFFINAGDAGNASTGKTGATGGSVTNIGGGVLASGSTNLNFSINTDTNFHHVSAGNGGNAVGTGGLGGSVSNVNVNAAIGARTGLAFGFDLSGMGGISAGAGGSGATHGLAGNVTSISADAIASIVAGHLGAVGVATGSGGTFSGDALQKTNLATKVDGIILNQQVAPSTVQQFTLSYDGETTVPIPTNSTPLEVAAAINALLNFGPASATGGVHVKQVGSGYQIIFNNTGAFDTITAQESAPLYATELTVGNAITSEVQNVQVFPATNPLNPSDTTYTNYGFSLTFGDQTTGILPPNATPAQVATALNALSSVMATGPANSGTVSVTTGAGFANPSYNITFNSPGSQSNSVIPNFVINTTVSSGSPSTAQNEVLSLPTRGDFVPLQFSTANLVGGIQNILRPDAATFTYTPFVTGGTFQFGDTPIDGLIAAVTLTSNKNFVPEALVTVDAGGAAVLIDNLVS